MEDKSTLIEVMAAVVERSGRYLICQRPLHKRHGGLWEFPGGKRQPGESRDAAINREMAEELAVTAQVNGDPLFVVHDTGSPFLVVFLPVTIHGELQLLEHITLAWCPSERLPAYRLAPSDERFLREYLLGA